jgi:hypothetical protein
MVAMLFAAAVGVGRHSLYRLGYRSRIRARDE